MEIIEYSNIIKDIDQIRALKRKEEFYSANGVYDATVNNYKMLEFFSNDISMNESIIDEVLRKSCSDYLNSYCFYISNSNFKSRVRSYKGFINTMLVNPVEYTEDEIEIGNNMSFFIGVINLKTNYQEIFDNLFFDSSRCFVFCTNECFEIDTLIDTTIKTNGGITNLIFNYYYLIQTFITNDELILRSAGSSIENGIQVFSKKENQFFEWKNLS